MLKNICSNITVPLWDIFNHNFFMDEEETLDENMIEGGLDDGDFVPKKFDEEDENY